MSDILVKISELPAATALTGVEVIPLVQGGDTRKATVDAISGLQRSNQTIAVPADFASIQAALNSLALRRVPIGVLVDVAVTGHLTAGAQLTFAHPDAARVSVTGQALLTMAVSSTAAPTGSAGAYTVRAAVANSAGVSVGDVALISATSGGAGHELLRGAWRVTGVPDPTHIDLLVTAQRGTIPAGIAATLKLIRTVVSCPGVSGVWIPTLANLSNIAFVGNGTAGTFGFYNTDAGTMRATDAAFIGFGDDGVSPRVCKAILTRVYASGNGNNGFNARESGAALKMSACVSSGNGNSTTYGLGGGGGFLAQQAASFEGYDTCEAWGNYGDGFKCRAAAAGLVDAPLAGWNGYNFRCGQNSFLQAFNATAKNAAANDYYADGGELLITGSTSAAATANGVEAARGGRVGAVGVTVTSAGANGFAATNGGFVDASGSNVVSCTGTPYVAAGRFGQVIKTGSTGLATAVPTVNTYDANYNTVVN